MATKDWTSTIDMLDRLCRKYGRAIVLTSETPGTPDPARPWDTPEPVKAEFGTYGVFVDPNNSEDNYDFAEKIQFRSQVRRSDYHVYVSAKGMAFRPKSGDKLRDSEESFEVVTVSPIRPGEQAIGYILQVQV